VDADEYPVVDGASVDHSIVADGNLIADDGRSVGIHHMDAGVILDIAALADTDVIHITADSHIEPYTGFVAQNHVPDDVGTGGDKIRRVDDGLLVEELV